VNETVVRAGVESDADVIADFNIKMALETEHLRLDPPTVLAGVRAGIADPAKARYFVAEVDGSIVGQLMLTHEWSDWRNGDIWWIESVYVHVDHRGRGVFGTLYRHVEQLARREGVVGLRLYVEKDNAAAQKTYARLGMSMTNYNVMEQMF
jgi:ribosomal protein S18 acetylase RimI-like enzyme